MTVCKGLESCALRRKHVEEADAAKGTEADLSEPPSRESSGACGVHPRTGLGPLAQTLEAATAIAGQDLANFYGGQTITIVVGVPPVNTPPDVVARLKEVRDT